MAKGTRHFGPDQGVSYPVGRMKLTFKTQAADSVGGYCLLEAVVPPDSGSGFHRHLTYDETLIVVEGRFEVRADEKRFVAGPGEVVFLPREAAHAFRGVGPETARCYFICAPGETFEKFMADVAAAHVETGRAVSGPAVDFRAIAGKYGVEFLE